MIWTYLPRPNSGITADKLSCDTSEIKLALGVWVGEQVKTPESFTLEVRNSDGLSGSNWWRRSLLQYIAAASGSKAINNCSGLELLARPAC